MSRHQGDCHWNTIYCRECSGFVAEWYDKGRDEKPDDICDRCSRRLRSTSRNEGLVEMLKEKLYQMIETYEPKRCQKCNKVLLISELSEYQRSDDILNPYNDNPYQRCYDCQTWSPYDSD